MRYRCSWDGLGHWLVSHMAPWQPAMSGCDLGGAESVTHCRLSHIHRVVPLLSPAEAHIALSRYGAPSVSSLGSWNFYFLWA